MGARVDLFTAAAERSAFASGRAKSQELTEILHPETAAAFYCICGGRLTAPLARCPGCGK